jgi:hypothetical protein
MHDRNVFDIAIQTLRTSLRAACDAGICTDDIIDADDIATMQDPRDYVEFMDDLRDRVGVDTDCTRIALAIYHGHGVAYVVANNAHQVLSAEQVWGDIPRVESDYGDAQRMADVSDDPTARVVMVSTGVA